MTETILFSFPSITLSLAGQTPQTGYLVLSSCPQPTDFDPSRFDIYLRLQHTAFDVLVEAWRELHKTSPTSFNLNTSFGDVSLTFPDLHLPLDANVDLPPDVRAALTWETVVADFEQEIDRFVSYRKNAYSLIEGGLDDFSGGKGGVQKYDPSVYSDEKKMGSGGRVVLVDEENGNEVGEMGGMAVETQGIIAGSKDPVEITLPATGDGPVIVRPADYLKDAMSPEYANSSLVQTAATASRLIVTTAAAVSNALSAGARTFTEKTRPVATPMTFQPSTHARVAQFHNATVGVARFSSATVGKVSNFAQNAGAKLVGKDKERTKGNPTNPNILNKSLIAFSTVADSIDYASKSLLASSSQAATQIVGHRYGPEAQAVAHSVTGVAKNVGLVYIDAAGVSRRAVVRGVAKGTVVGRVKGGGEVVVPAGQQTQIDGIPAGWGDGPLGGPQAGPPSRAASPMPYTSVNGGVGSGAMINQPYNPNEYPPEKQGGLPPSYS